MTLGRETKWAFENCLKLFIKIINMKVSKFTQRTVIITLLRSYVMQTKLSLK